MRTLILTIPLLLGACAQHLTPMQAHCQLEAMKAGDGVAWPWLVDLCMESMR